MKILFDSQVFDWQINGGISRYFIEVLQRLKYNQETEVLFRCRHSYNTYIQETQWLASKPKFKKIHFKGKLRLVKNINEKINRPYSNRILKRGSFDIFHPTYYDPYFLRYLGKRPLILTVYDLTYEKLNIDTFYTKKILPWRKQLIQRANHIISISENTKKDIIEYYGIAPDKITTVYLSGGFDFIDKSIPQSEMKNIPENYFLFVGSRSGYKNFSGFIKQAAPVMIEENVSLIIAGGGPMNNEELNMLRQLNIAGRTISFSHVSDPLLQQLYKNALVFIFPSLYEGFGIPVLEAMQCGCPALLSNNSSLPEVGGKAALYFDPLEKDDLKSALKRLLCDETKRKEMIKAGFEQLKKFNWDATTQGHIEVYKKITA